MATLLMISSALITALANLLIRRGLDVAPKASGDPFISQRFFTAALMVLFVILWQHGSIPIDPNMLLVGIAGGLALGALQFTIGRCLFYGPPALSFIFVSAACVIPPIIMFFIFGEDFGHGYTLYNLLGSILVLAGLYWMAQSQGFATKDTFKKWCFWAFIAFLCGVLHQLVLQWRALLLKPELPPSALIPFHVGAAESDFYMVTALCTAALCQMLFQKPAATTAATTDRKQTLICGIGGGLLNGLSTYLMILGTEWAKTDLEKAMIFPIFTVLLITTCNIWAKMLYKEKVNWPANAVCMTGILVGMR